MEDLRARGGMSEIYMLVVALMLVALSMRAEALTSGKYRYVGRFQTSIRGKMGMPEHMTEGEAPDADEGGDKVTVRFQLGGGKKDVVVEANLGANLMLIADECGVKMSRACRTGLCGTCTTVVKDPMAVVTPSNPREGWATIRACSTKCYPPPGLDEMVVDMGYMSTRAGSGGDGDTSSSSSAVKDTADTKASNPMARFSGDWEREFKPAWEMNKGDLRPGQKLSRDETVCTSCGGTGRIDCYNCGGTGVTRSLDGSRVIQCSLCVGQHTITCPTCKGKGVMQRKRRIRM